MSDKEYHDYFNDLPFFPANIIIEEASAQNLKGYKGQILVPQLTAILYPKNHLWVHYLYLKLAIQKGFRVTEFGQTIWIRQDNDMKAFIDNIGRKRANAKTYI